MRPADKQHAVSRHTWSAWRVKLRPDTLAQTATLLQWLVHCPGAHAAWSYWLISLLHLRAIEGVPPAVKDFEQAEHELNILALDPRSTPDPDDKATWHHLLPIDVVVQFHGLTDEQAVQSIDAIVERLVVRGMLSPDSDCRRQWQRQIQLCVEHQTTGHPKAHA